MLDLTCGSERQVLVNAEALRDRLRPDLAEALIPPDATAVLCEFRYSDEQQTYIRVAGHTAAAVASKHVLQAVK